MKIAFLCHGNFDRGIQKYIYDGFTSLGFDVEQHNPGAWQPGNFREADLCVTNGFHRRTKAAAAEYAEKGVPVIVFDLGYLKRASTEDWYGYFQAGLGKLNWMPPFDVPSDRFEKLEMAVEKKRPMKAEGFVLILGQKFDDAQHGMSETETRRWVHQMVANAKAWAPDLDIVFRPHPKSIFELPGIKFDDPRLTKIGEAVSGATVVVTFNSTSGVEVVRQGIPLLCAPHAHFAHLSGGDPNKEESWKEFKSADYEDRLSHLSKLAYSQWTPGEIQSGEAIHFLLAAAGKKIKEVDDRRTLVDVPALSSVKAEDEDLEEEEVDNDVTDQEPGEGQGNKEGTAHENGSTDDAGSSNTEGNGGNPIVNSPPVTVLKKVSTMSRTELMDELEAGGVSFSKNAKFDKLAELVKEKRKAGKAK